MRNMLRSTLSLGALLMVGMLAATPAMAQVEISAEMTGDAMPGAEVSITATYDIQDGSDFVSIAWEQVFGVDAVLAGADTDTVTVTLGAEGDFKDALIHALTHPLVTQDQLPPNVVIPEHGAFGGRQDRWGVVAVNPLSHEEAALVVLEITVVTSSGTYTEDYEIHTHLPWKWAGGIMTVPMGHAVILNAKDQETYDWALSAPDGSEAALDDAAAKHPWFMADMAGTYEATVTDAETAEPVTLTIYAGTWEGILAGLDDDGRPVSQAACTGCHSGFAPDLFTPWAQTGHAEIWGNNLNTNDHYSTNCFPCHTVGYDPEVDNGGIDDAEDFQAFLDADYFHSTDPNDYANAVANQPATAQLGNIQCENCHGPQNDSSAHGPMSPVGEPRVSLSSDVCAVCHGEPARHARYQQWQLSNHANFELAMSRGTRGSCGKCHSAQGFLAMLATMLDDDPDTDPLDDVEVDWTADTVQPQTCQTCHDPHAIGTTSGSSPNATVRVSGDTPDLPSGWMATDVGKGAICMTCHNTRRGLRNDDNYDPGDKSRAPHGGAQGDVVMGQNAYFVDVPQRGYHSMIEDTCSDCHMEATPPPDVLSYNQGGTNHTFFAREDICSECHSVVTYEDVAGPVEEALHHLEESMIAAYADIMARAFDNGASIDWAGDATITSMDEIAEIHLGESHGRQGFALMLADATELEAHSLDDIMIVPAMGDPIEFVTLVPDTLAKVGWNYWLIHSDGSHGVHNPKWVMEILSESLEEMEEMGVEIPEGDETGPGVACLSPFTYWTEIAAHNPGSFGTTWRTDVVGQNMGDGMATIQFILHTATGNVTMDSTIDAGAQAVYEDIVGLMGIEDDKGALEICSDMPLSFVARIYNQADEGTFGQFMNGLTYLLGLHEGDTAKLLGLRQMTDIFRTNISVTNTGTETAEVTIALYGTDGTMLESYALSVDPGMVIQDGEPFRTRAGSPDLGWGYATVTVDSGMGVLTSASVVDSVTGDATTIPMKR